MIRKLPIFKGYTVDLRLQEFRKIETNKLPEFIPFTSNKGAKIFHDFILTSQGRQALNKYLERQT
ncbi:hypothetical protein EOM09_06460 [bacterium]|nr:hypothetical protein [bacterium]